MNKTHAKSIQWRANGSVCMHRMMSTLTIQIMKKMLNYPIPWEREMQVTGKERMVKIEENLHNG